jgi:hypothetical protein
MRHRFRFDLPVKAVRADTLVLDMGNGVSATLHVEGVRQCTAMPTHIPMFVELPAECIIVAPEIASETPNV